MIPEINIKDYSYNLPDERIAKYPLPERDSSKLLLYKEGEVGETIFRNITDYLPENSVMIFNDTKVVPARLHFQRSTGAHIEIFCLRPESPAEYVSAFDVTGSCEWKCVIGNAKRWKGDTLRYFVPQDAEINEDFEALNLRADLVSRDGQLGIVRYTWDGNIPFSHVLEMCGRVPIPPYLNRETEDIDVERYQTTYAHVKGSVAAPTAGLHFTDEVLQSIRKRGIDTENVCLHVGAGTFLPVKTQQVSGHTMHREPFVVGIDLLRKLAAKDFEITAVGTTSVRTLESLYYVGVSCIENGQPEDVRQWAPYEREYGYSTEESLMAIVGYLEKNGLKEITVGTKIIIVPGFRFRLVDYLVTNFHQSESTLLLLVSAFVGGDWRTIYNYALDNGFRFLSYGDSSLLKRA
ncbi:MAG: S-adenosylmethionine:tRNA ribosyltransferase-isomerase [Bacteroidales bacterium]|nr:S-adenosylmethionine:tRNA ribosyltransferase-isomerase [Bacteroidales bacterium]